jgi:protease II
MPSPPNGSLGFGRAKLIHIDLLFKTDMVAGHSGRSGRLGSIEESAEIMGWLIAHLP